jgi:flagellar FliL protein
MASPAGTEQPIVTIKSDKLKRSLLIAMGIIVLLGAGAAYLLLYGPDLPELENPAPAPPVFFPLESMTVNLQSDDSMHYLRIGLTLELSDRRSQAALVERMPEVRSSILMTLSAKRPEDLEGIDGKLKLAKELLAIVENADGAPGNPRRVQEVLFTEFVIQ